MVCQACGSEITAADVRFCPKCGAQIVATQPGTQPGAPPSQQQYAGYQGYPPYPPVVAASRVQRHLQTLSMLWCLYAVYRVASGLIGMFWLRAVAWRRMGWYGPFGDFGWHGPTWMALLPVIATITVVIAGLALLTGFSLMRRRPGGRTLAIVMAILALFKPLVGTALGIYTLWVLAPAASGAEYDAIADRS